MHLNLQEICQKSLGCAGLFDFGAIFINTNDFKEILENIQTFETEYPSESKTLQIIINRKQERNSKCFCGSDKKHKKCCGAVYLEIWTLVNDFTNPVPLSIAEKIIWNDWLLDCREKK